MIQCSIVSCSYSSFLNLDEFTIYSKTLINVKLQINLSSDFKLSYKYFYPIDLSEDNVTELLNLKLWWASTFTLFVRLHASLERIISGHLLISHKTLKSGDQDCITILWYVTIKYFLVVFFCVPEYYVFLLNPYFLSNDVIKKWGG